jgi:hypothetical protein
LGSVSRPSPERLATGEVRRKATFRWLPDLPVLLPLGA